MARIRVTPDKRIWTHPERDGADIDLSVMTTNEVPGSKDAPGR